MGSDHLLTSSYDVRLVVLSVAVAVLASGAALDLAARVAASRGRARVFWLAGGAVAMGLGIWSMHYVGMLAFHLTVPVYYDVATVLASLLAAILASAVALYVVSRKTLGLTRLLTGGLVMGAGIAAMHYSGMAAMRMAATVVYRPVILALSIAIAVVVALVALLLAFHLRAEAIRTWDWRRLVSAIVMGAAVPAMHYTGMAAAHFVPAADASGFGRAVSISSLGAVAIASATVLVLAFAIGTSMLDRHLAAQAGALARFAAIIESSNDAIIATTLDRTILSWNPAAERLFGWKAAEVLGQPGTFLVPADRAAESEALARRLLSGERVDHHETVRLRRDGTPVDVSVTYSPIRDRAGTITGVSTIVRDHTVQRQAADALRRARDLAEDAARARSAFLANMSHEIRTPMNAVLGLTELLLGTELNAEQRRQLELVHSSGEGLLTTLNDILDFSKLESSRVELEDIPFDLPRLVHGTARLLAIKAEQQGVELLVDIAPDVPATVRGDPGRVRQVLTNLLGNAVKFTDAGEIVVAVTVPRRDAETATLQFTVRDTGIGISRDRLDAIFDAFSQADVSTTRCYGGTGLGLSISRRLVALMGGALTVTSTPGRGSAFTFTVTLSVATHAAALAPAVRLAGVKVLVVDDNATNRRIVVEALRGAGVVTDAVSDASQAVAALRAAWTAGAPYRLAVIDGHMPDGDGFSLANDLLRDTQLAGTRLLMLTSGGERGDAHRCRDLGIRGYLTKPVSQAELLDAVAVVVGADGDSADALVVTRHTIEESRRSLRVLLAEDNLVNQEVAASMLRQRGHTVDIVGDGRAAVRAIANAREPYHVVLMDIQMPEMDGRAATEAIRALPGGAAQRIVALTAHASGAERDRCLAAGMDGHLTKPFKSFELFAAVELGRSESATTPSGMSSAPARAPAVDIAGFRAELREAGIEAAAERALAHFRAEAPVRMAAIESAVASRHAHAIDRAAHALQSSAGTIRARTFAGLLNAMRQAAGSGDVDAAVAQIEPLRAEYAAVEACLGAAPAPGS